MRHSFILLTAVMLLSIPVLPIYGKNGKVKCEGTYRYVYEAHVSHAEARVLGVEYAIQCAIAEKLGTTITSESRLEMTNSNEWFAHVSRFHVKGKFLRHIKEPQISDPIYADNLSSIEISVSFYAQPLEYAPTAFKARVLRNGTEPRFEDDTFRAGDKFYMQFRSPKAGFLAIFFETTDNVICMLPYIGEEDEPFWVKKGEDYTLFEVENNTYHMSCDEKDEINFVHIVFSPKSFIHNDLEREMSLRDFSDWLDSRRAYDEQLEVETRMIKVSKGKEY